MSDLIERQAAYTTLTEYYHHTTEIQHKALREALERVPSAQPETHEERTETHACDLIDRQAAIDYCYALINAENPSDPSDEWNYSQERINQTEVILHHLEVMPSAQPYERCIAEIKIDKDDLEELVAEKVEEIKKARPEIIQCKDCKHWLDIDDGRQKHRMCADIYGDWFCADAERRTDG